MKSFAAVLAFAATANATCAPGQWNTAWNDALLCDQEQCAVQCLGNAGCTTNCMLARNPTYDKCGVTCASNAAGCGLSQCFSQCLSGCNQNCVNCTAPRCGPAYASCLGVAIGQQPTTCCPQKNDFLSTMEVAVSKNATVSAVEENCTPTALGALYPDITVAWCNANCFDGEGSLAPACDPEEAGQLCQCSGCVPTQYGSQFPGITEQWCQINCFDGDGNLNPACVPGEGQMCSCPSQ